MVGSMKGFAGGGACSDVPRYAERGVRTVMPFEEAMKPPARGEGAPPGGGAPCEWKTWASLDRCAGADCTRGDRLAPKALMA